MDSFAAKRNIRDADTIDQMAAVVASMFGREITYDKLIAGDRGLAVDEFLTLVGGRKYTTAS